MKRLEDVFEKLCSVRINSYSLVEYHDQFSCRRWSGELAASPAQKAGSTRRMRDGMALAETGGGAISRGISVAAGHARAGPAPPPAGRWTPNTRVACLLPTAYCLIEMEWCIQRNIMNIVIRLETALE